MRLTRLLGDGSIDASFATGCTPRPDERDAGSWHCAVLRMNSLEVIEAAAAAELVDEDGDRAEWKPLPGLTGKDISTL